MRTVTIIKNKFGKNREISLRHLILAVTAGLLISFIALICPPLDTMTLTPLKWMLTFSIPFAALFLFYVIIQKPERTVYSSIKHLYCIIAPLSPLLLAYAVFDTGKSDIYSESFFSRFLPQWTAVWWLGIAAVYALMLGAEYTLSRRTVKKSYISGLIHALAVMYTPQKVIGRHKAKGNGKWAAAAVCMLMIAAGVLLGTVALYLYCVYSNMEFEAILFTMRFAAGGLAIEDIIAGAAIFLIFASITLYFCFHLIKCFRNDKLVVADKCRNGKYTLIMNGRKRAALILISAVLFITGAAVFSAQTGFMHYMAVKNGKSNVYESYYVKPDESVIAFPEKKRNLIYIYIESMENTYASKEAGGSQEINYISELTELTKDNNSVSFSNTEQLGGPSVFVPSITYTMGSTVAQTSGISLNTKLLPQAGEIRFPSVITLEDILHNNGYSQLYIEGSKGEFSMYDKYVGRYEDSRVFDRKTAADEGYTDESADYMWKWGIEDRKLFEITEKLITDMSHEEKPFFVTMYTMDTHSFECGHRCPNCDSSITNDYLASVDCTSRAVNGFVEWVKQQPFYENTTIVLIGDHLGNKKTSKVNIDDDYLRTTYNCIINPAKTPDKTQNRIFSSLDMFPTTLSAIGAEIKGDRLGLGTDLFSPVPTLCEKLGEEEYKRQLEQDSDYYDREFYVQ